MLDVELARVAARRLNPYRDPDVVEAALVGLRQRRRRRRRMTRLALAGGVVVAMVALVASVAFGARRSSAHTIAVALAPLPAPRTVDAAPEDPPPSVQLRLDDGAARFAGAHPVRRIEVAARSLRIVSQGAIFAAAWHGDTLAVSVERGLVEVDWSGGHTTLREGEARTFPPAHVEPARRTPARRRDPIAVAPPPVVTDPVGELLDAADVARRAGHPADAAVALRRAAAIDDPRQSAVLFTLGKVLLDDLARPADAADAFARARARDPDGALAEDALAREIVARGQAGQTDRAATLARTYLDRYPSGHRRRAVAAWATP